MGVPNRCIRLDCEFVGLTVWYVLSNRGFPVVFLDTDASSITYGQIINAALHNQD